MNREWKIFAAMVAVFAAAYYLPLADARIISAMGGQRNRLPLPSLH